MYIGYLIYQAERPRSAAERRTEDINRGEFAKSLSRVLHGRGPAGPATPAAAATSAHITPAAPAAPRRRGWLCARAARWPSRRPAGLIPAAVENLCATACGLCGYTVLYGDLAGTRTTQAVDKHPAGACAARTRRIGYPYMVAMAE